MFTGVGGAAREEPSAYRQFEYAHRHCLVGGISTWPKPTHRRRCEALDTAMFNHPKERAMVRRSRPSGLQHPLGDRRIL